MFVCVIWRYITRRLVTKKQIPLTMYLMCSIFIKPTQVIIMAKLNGKISTKQDHNYHIRKRDDSISGFT